MAKMEDLKVQVEISQPSLIRIKALQLTVEQHQGAHVNGGVPSAQFLIDYAAKLEGYIVDGQQVKS